MQMVRGDFGGKVKKLTRRGKMDGGNEGEIKKKMAALGGRCLNSIQTQLTKKERREPA